MIHKNLISQENITLNYIAITKILIWTRNLFAHYIKDPYKFNKLIKRSGGCLISEDESLLVHIDDDLI